MKLVGMAERILEAHDFRTVTHPHVERLASEIGQSVLAGVLGPSPTRRRGGCRRRG
jgi:DNA-binding IclR family transcriptional regulator